jgi:hypothetical protein
MARPRRISLSRPGRGSLSSPLGLMAIRLARAILTRNFDIFGWMA